MSWDRQALEAQRVCLERQLEAANIAHRGWGAYLVRLHRLIADVNQALAKLDAKDEPHEHL